MRGLSVPSPLFSHHTATPFLSTSHASPGETFTEFVIMKHFTRALQYVVISVTSVNLSNVLCVCVCVCVRARARVLFCRCFVLFLTRRRRQ